MRIYGRNLKNKILYVKWKVNLKWVETVKDYKLEERI